jgi:mono/diheme cytochrome c family protein
MKTATPSLFLGLLLLLPAAVSAQENRIELARKARDILKANCYACHGQDGKNEGGFNYALELKALVTRRKVVAGEPGKSRLYKRMISDDDPMPPASEKQRPTKDEIAVLKRWIEAGAPETDMGVGKRAFIAEADILSAIFADLQKVDERQRRFVRYFTITHLYNVGLSDDELQTYRHGLSKLLNSLSWGRKVVAPPPIDAAKTILRIDLRDYQWNAERWSGLLTSYPYGITQNSPLAKAVYATTASDLPYVRADWFVYAASQPPLYHDLLQLPQTEAELEKLVRVDATANIRGEQVARAGFNSSGVSRNNRLIERHESSYGAYWKSYDFAGNVGRKNLFANPLGPGTDVHSFQHDGGEIIFNLPNGLQGYLLTDARGQRLDKGPTTIVSDDRQPDRAVVNGVSCMSCHAKGMIFKADQVREHVVNNPNAFDKETAATVLVLYPAKEKFDRLLKEDADRFAKAVEKTGAHLSRTEPIVALALRFTQELDLPLAAAESGLSVDAFLDGLTRSSELARHLGPLKTAGGTVQREAYVAAFPEIVGQLQLGQYLRPSGVALIAPNADKKKANTPVRFRSTVVELTDKAHHHWGLPEVKVGIRVWSDKEYVITKLPAEMAGATFLSRDTGFIKDWLAIGTVKALRDCTVYAIVRAEALNKVDVGDAVFAAFDRDGWTEVVEPFETTFNAGENWVWRTVKRNIKPGDVVLPLRNINFRSPVLFAFK